MLPEGIYSHFHLASEFGPNFRHSFQNNLMIVIKYFFIIEAKNRSKKIGLEHICFHWPKGGHYYEWFRRGPRVAH
jgi:hypothetical protein